MPNPPVTSKLATGYQSSSVPIRRAAAAGYGSGRVPRTKIKGKFSQPHIPPVKKKEKPKRMSHKQTNPAIEAPKQRRMSYKQSKRLVKEKPIKTGGG